MMKLTCLAQGSTGNCWVLEDNGRRIILDVGIPLKKIKAGIDYDLMSIDCVLVTHRHKDHSYSVKDFEDMGIDVFKPYENDKRIFRAGDFTIHTFDVPHDGTPCFGFLIKKGGFVLLYATDFEYIKYRFKSQMVTHVLIECNYQKKYVDENSDNLSHKVLGHCELDTCINFLKNSLGDEVKKVIVTHLGVGTADGNEIVEEISGLYGDGVFVDYARQGETYNI